MTTAEDVLRIARQHLNETESPPGSNRQQFGVWYGLNGVPWCAIFVSFCFFTAGLPLPIRTSKGFSYCPDGVAWFQSRGRWSTTPQVGSPVFYHFDGEHPGANHVGIVEALNADGSITTIEGNTSAQSDANGGQVERRVRRGGIILGYGLPSFSSGPPGPHGAPKWPGRMIALTSPLTRGDDVRTWQAKMGDRGWHLEVDGVYGPKSRDICVAFQHEKKLEADGVIGPQTWNATWTAPITP
jgi:hypothetical protein